MEILQRLLFLRCNKTSNSLCVENPCNFGVNGNSKAGPAVSAAPEMWNILFPEG